MEIYKKMALVMKDIGAVSKDQKNEAQRFKFRGIDQFVNTLYPALVKHSVFMSPRVVKIDNDIKEVERSSGKKGYDKHVNLLVEYDFFCEDGSKVTIGPVAGEGLDSGDKATSKAMSMALKYALIQTFSIPTEDLIDGDKESPEITSGMKQTLTAAMPTASTKEETATVVEMPKKKVSFSKKSLTASTGDDI